MTRKRAFKRIKAQLEAKRDELIHDLTSGIGGEQSSQLYEAKDSPEMASRSTESEMVFQLVEMESDELEEIEEALNRIEAGTYGVCEMCGKPISRERLEALPATALCVACKSAQESDELHLHHAEAVDWDRVEEFERAERMPLDKALDRGEKIT